MDGIPTNFQSEGRRFESCRGPLILTVVEAGEERMSIADTLKWPAALASRQLPPCVFSAVPVVGACESFSAIGTAAGPLELG